MNGLISIIRLTRPINLLIIAATMYAVRWLLITKLLADQPQIQELAFPEFLFFLSVCVMVLLAAAGNIINDYFDQKVDRINRPERVIVGKLVKRRVAIVLHQIFNITAVLITLFLAAKSGMWWVLGVPVSMATVLWIYSPVLKKNPFVGNLAVALCVAVVPWWAGLFELETLRHSQWDALFQPDRLFAALNYWIWAYVFFAFLLTLSRESVKDMEDLEGDRAEMYKTLPLVWGESRTRFYSLILQVICICGTSYLLWITFAKLDSERNFIFAVLGLILIQIITAIKTYNATSKADYHSSSMWHKWVMAAGLCVLFFA
ncbi:MAG: geranylgeranylglycerol-phosphate geranylgeranyltransferase [Flavobacteriales bacterium]|nr:geranylgeranylglycerol-phosphate geranylgeranyltransferase [Flavobacteriales bacterium]